MNEIIAVWQGYRSTELPSTTCRTYVPGHIFLGDLNAAANELDIGASEGLEEDLNFRQGYVSVSHSRQRYASTGYRQYIESVLRRQASRPQRPASLCFLSVKDMVQVTRLAFGLMVKVVSHGTDRYGRILGDIFLPDGSMLNECLVEEGWAWHYTRYSNNPRFN